MRPRRDPLRDAGALLERVYAYVAYRIGPGSDADDVTGETFERAVRYRASYDPARGEPVAWLLGIAQRCLADRGRGSVPSIADEKFADPLDVEEDVVRRLTLEEAVAALGERDRELIGLRYGADLSTREIAGFLGLSTNAVDVAMHRALSRLRATLEGRQEV